LVEHDGEWEKSPGTALQNEKKGANEYWHKKESLTKGVKH
jgi:hypothetical protein